jgi:hypothetical protein
LFKYLFLHDLKRVKPLVRNRITVTTLSVFFSLIEIIIIIIIIILDVSFTSPYMPYNGCASLKKQGYGCSFSMTRRPTVPDMADIL